MSKYFQSINVNNIVQIDDSFQNLELISSAEIKGFKEETDSYGQNVSHYYLNSILPDNANLAAVVPNDTLINTMKQYADPRVSFLVASRGAFIENTKKTIRCLNITLPVTYIWEAIENNPNLLKKIGFKVFYFGKSEDPPSKHGCGLEIYSATGKIVFNSEKKYLDVSNGQFGTLSYPLSEMTNVHNKLKVKETILFDADGVYAVCPSIYPVYTYFYSPQAHRMGAVGYIYELSQVNGKLHTKIILGTVDAGYTGTKDIDGISPLETDRLEYSALYLIVKIPEEECSGISIASEIGPKINSPEFLPYINTEGV